MADVFKQGHALVIGIAHYSRVRPLPSTILNDAKDVGALLTSPDYCAYPAAQVQRLLDDEATAAGIRAGLGRLASRAGPDDTAFIYFSGHGARRKDGGGAYVLPHDCDPADLATTALGADELTAAFGAIPCRKLVVILDACHSAGAGELKAPDPDDPLESKALDPDVSLKGGLDREATDALSRGAGRVILCSSRADEVSLVFRDMENSLFTHYLLEAMRGGAPGRGDGKVRVFDVFEYVSDKVPARAPGQHPNFKAHLVEENFALALDRGGWKSAAGAPGGGAPPQGLAPRPRTLTGKARVVVVQRLVARWKPLADYFDVPNYDRAAFDRGDEPRGVLDWLEERDRLRELRDAFTYLGFDDLIAVLDTYPA